MQLRKIPDSIWRVKEAKSIRGLSDIYGCVKGRHVELEVKKSEKEASETTGRIVLQKHEIQKCIKAGGYASLIYPENAQAVLLWIRNL